MTVDETIKHCEDIAKSLWCEGKEESAEEHLILAAWLRDYKRMQEPKTGHFRDSISRDYLLSIANKDGAYGYVSAHDIINAPCYNPKEPKTDGDAIGRQAAIDAIEKYKMQPGKLSPIETAFNDGIETAMAEIGHNVPSVNPQEPMTGHWIYRKGYIPYKWKCDRCFASSKTDFNYCPNCGARMSEVSE